MGLEALIIVPAVGWTSDSAVHRIPRRRWWTALRLSTLRCPVAGTVVKAGNATRVLRKGKVDVSAHSLWRGSGQPRGVIRHAL